MSAMEMAENIRMDEEVEKLQGQICKDGDPGGKKNPNQFLLAGTTYKTQEHGN